MKHIDDLTEAERLELFQVEELEMRMEVWGGNGTCDNNGCCNNPGCNCDGNNGACNTGCGSNYGCGGGGQSSCPYELQNMNCSDDFKMMKKQ